MPVSHFTVSLFTGFPFYRFPIYRYPIFRFRFYRFRFYRLPAVQVPTHGTRNKLKVSPTHVSAINSCLLCELADTKHLPACSQCTNSSNNIMHGSKRVHWTRKQKRLNITTECLESGHFSVFRTLTWTDSLEFRVRTRTSESLRYYSLVDLITITRVPRSLRRCIAINDNVLPTSSSSSRLRRCFSRPGGRTDFSSSNCSAKGTFLLGFTPEVRLFFNFPISRS